MIESKDEVQQYWKEKEHIYGGPVEYRAFARLLGSTRQGSVDLAGLIFIASGQMVFEDFEKQPGFLNSLFFRKKAGTYKKTEFSIKTADIREIKIVSQTAAKAMIAGSLKETKPIAGIQKIVSVSVHEFVMDGGFSYFFEVLNKVGPETILKKTAGETPALPEDAR